MLLEVANDQSPQQQLRLINDIQRLGVAYHFKIEIDEALKHMNNKYYELCGTDTVDDLNFVALCFRLLRQHGYNVRSDVFNKFKEERNGIFKESLSKDVEGLLSLYEATHLRVHGENILEEALAFTTSHLESLQTHQLKKHLAAQVIHALKIPVWKSVNRTEARHYIFVYENEDFHSEALLCFAKLDFNVLQKLHQRELGEISSWWLNFNFKERMPFARDRSVECYFCTVCMSFEPQYSLARKILAKVFSLITVLDDIYDVYGTVEELTLLTEAIQRWDISALDQLPEYMRYVYRVLLGLYTEVEEELCRAGIPSDRGQYAKISMQELIRSFFFEAKCINKWLVPTMDEYMQNSLVSTTVPLLATHFFVGMGHMVTKEALDWISTYPLIIRAGSLFCRLTDDIAEHKEGKTTEDTAYVVECYMKQHGVSKENTYSDFEKQKVDAWKDMNSECLLLTASIPLPLVTVALSAPRLTYVLYPEDIDGFTKADTRTKEVITSVLVDPIPI